MVVRVFFSLVLYSVECVCEKKKERKNEEEDDIYVSSGENGCRIESSLSTTAAAALPLDRRMRMCVYMHIYVYYMGSGYLTTRWQPAAAAAVCAFNSISRKAKREQDCGLADG